MIPVLSIKSLNFRMDTLRSEIRKTLDDVVNHLEVLEGTPYTDCINLVRIELSNRLEDIANMVTSNDTLVVNPKALIHFTNIEGVRYRVCHIAAQLAGEGTSACAGVGVAWAEDVPYNISMRVLSNAVNKRTSELWAILIAARTAIARGFARIIICSENYTLTKRLFTDATTGKLDQTECVTLANKLKEYVGTGLVIRIPDEIEDACVSSGTMKVKKQAKKLAKDAFNEARRDRNN